MSDPLRPESEPPIVQAPPPMPVWATEFDPPRSPARSESNPWGWQPRLWRLTWVMVAVAICWAIPDWVERVQYAVTRGQQRAKADVARTQLARLEASSEAFRLVAQSLEPSVVHIDALRGDLDERRGPLATGEGSGVIVDPAGYVLTNYHVIADATQVDVHLSDGRALDEAQIVGVDPLTDLAVLRVEGQNLVAAPWGDSDALEVGDWVLAVGSPFGLDRSVTAGIVSAKRERGAINDNPHQQFLQTDAAVNPGNSGGPLVNLRGEVVGINTQIVGQSFQGVSFAIPSGMARDVCERLRREGTVKRGWLGVAQRELNDELAQQLSLDGTGGSLITEVIEGSPAESAGLQAADVVLSWNGTRIADPVELAQLVAATPIGTQVEMEIVRDGKRQTLEVTVAERPRRP